MSERWLIVDTIPKDARNQGSINMGLEIVASRMGADRANWWDRVEVSKYTVIAFNVFYVMHFCNILPFLKENGIVRDKNLRTSHRLIAGGQAFCPDNKNILSEVLDEVFLGEFDLDVNGTQIITEPIIKGNKAVIELTRGCRMACKFCEYRYKMAPYREKPIELVREQIFQVAKGGVSNINFMSANFAGYSKLEELMEICREACVRVLNGDSCLAHIRKLIPYRDIIPAYLKIGVESFDEKTRTAVGKPYSDAMLFETLEQLWEEFSVLHLYLIYGLPGDDYEKWVEWLVKIRGIMRKTTTRSLRAEFSVTNFEPCYGTELYGAGIVDFREKAKFFKLWTSSLRKYKFHLGETVDYKNAGGRVGKKEYSYNMVMALRRGGGQALDTAIDRCFPTGISRSVSDAEAKKFLDYIEAVREFEEWKDPDA